MRFDPHHKGVKSHTSNQEGDFVYYNLTTGEENVFSPT